LTSRPKNISEHCAIVSHFLRKLTVPNLTRECNDEGWMPTFKVQGQVRISSHRITAASYTRGTKVSTDMFYRWRFEAVDRRCSVMPGLKSSTVHTVSADHAARRQSIYVQRFKCAIDCLMDPARRCWQTTNWRERSRDATTRLQQTTSVSSSSASSVKVETLS